MTRAPERILVIKLAALGDFVQAFRPFAAIRAHHPAAEITLLTTPPFAGLAKASPWFDHVWSDGRPSWLDPRGLWGLARRLRHAAFARVYDLQTSRRSSRYRFFVGAGAEWSGIARGASHPDADPLRDQLHTVERQEGQLRAAGITSFPEPDLAWLDADLQSLNLPAEFALILPGASPLRPGKRWPAERFGELAARIPLPAVICGVSSEKTLAEQIQARSPRAIDLTGRTSLLQLGAIARRARWAIGNDSGPTHLAAAAGCPTLAIFGGESDPKLCAPRGAHARFLRHIPIGELSVDEVLQALGD
ncbi:glycosyltransferase family 9 protein [Roseococcus sp. YIM B11640]|uniref:glycosyltransferase family 9 protein n=1 Tax=Roseococcus sp. YIM B11640 TaxID=3133973 RepID=UPI003C7DBB3E